ncbi:MAG: glutamine synthetase [Clostridia bacterium]|nr:glutamine synthetase [Clostridia bacterium]
MKYSKQEVRDFISENDVKFIRLAFCDVFGMQKNISIVSSSFDDANDCAISFDAGAAGFTGEHTERTYLRPDLSTLSVLPWRPSQGRVVRLFCDMLKPDKTPFECDTRALLKCVSERLENAGYEARIGTNCEFYLFKTDENGDPTKEPHDHGGYLDMMPLDRAENVRREICFTLEEMGISPESSHHEAGPGQNEIDFKYADPLKAADNFITFKYVVKSIAARNGLYASFMPKPFPEKNGNGLHINLSLKKDGENIFDRESRFNPEARAFIAGVLSRIKEITAVLNPTTNSYDRFGRFSAPGAVTISKDKRESLAVISGSAGKKTCLELRSPDSATNPYLAFALLLAAGMEGMEKGLMLDEAVSEPLPRSLKEALDIMKGSAFSKDVLGEAIFNNFVSGKTREVEAFELSTNREAFCDRMYFLRV